MTARPRMKILAISVGIALAQWGTGAAFADSAVGVDMAKGNAMNPPGRSSVPRPIADDGYDTVRHSPTGQLYGVPYDLETEATKTEGGWEYAGGIEAGLLGGDADTKNALFRKYKDLKNGAYLNYFEIEAEKADTAQHMSVVGGGTGQADQFYGIETGRYNDWELHLFYNETQHVFTDTWKSIFNGEGSGNLTPSWTTATPITTGSPNVGASPLVACTKLAPCWSYGGKTYSSASAAAAINGITGTPNATTGAIATVASTTTATGATQSNIAAAIAAKLAIIPDSELSLVRKKAGARLDKTITDNLKSYVSYTHEARTGARPFAMNEGNISTEIAEPIDYATHDFLAGLMYADKLTQANLRASMSFFRNNISELNVAYPFQNGAVATSVMQNATYDLYPDNNAFNLKGEFARSLPDFCRGRFNAALSWGTSQQDDALLAPISASQNTALAAAGITQLASTSIGYSSTTPALVSNWNTTSALSQQTSKQRIDNTMLDLGVSIKPTDALSMKGTMRYFDSNNKGGYMAYNPLTGQFGRGIADGNGTGLDLIVGLQPGATSVTPGSCYVPPGYPAVSGCAFGSPAANGSNNPVYGQARSTQQLNYGVSTDYELSNTSSANGVLEREEFKRDFRERDKTWENKLKLGYVNRGLGNATLRASYETDAKRGSEYRYRTFGDLGTGLPGLTPQEQIAALSATPVTAGYAVLNANLFSRYSYYFRKYDQADRDQGVFNFRLNLQAREDLDLGLVLQSKAQKYPDSVYGMDTDNQNSMSLEFNYQPSSDTNLYGYYSYQKSTKSMKLNSGIAGAASCTLANLATYGYAACSDTTTGLNGARPDASKWSMNSDDQSNLLGLGFQKRFGTIQVGVDYTYSSSSTTVDYQFGSAAISATVANQNAAALIAGTALPNMTFVQQTLNFNALVPISKKLSLRLYDRIELGNVTDWHYDGVIKSAMGSYDSGTLLLDSGPNSYRANVIGFLLQYKL